MNGKLSAFIGQWQAQQVDFRCGWEKLETKSDLVFYFCPVEDSVGFWHELQGRKEGLAQTVAQLQVRLSRRCTLIHSFVSVAVTVVGNETDFYPLPAQSLGG